MPTLGLTEREYNYYTESFREAFELIGQDAWLYQVETEDRDLYLDPQLAYHPPVPINIIFDSNPMVYLRKHNWVTEDEEIPYLAYIVGLDNNDTPIEVRENMKIKVVTRLGYHFDRLFNVEKVNLNHIDHFVFICKLTPYREQTVSNNIKYDDKSESGSASFKYLNFDSK